MLCYVFDRPLRSQNEYGGPKMSVHEFNDIYLLEVFYLLQLIRSHRTGLHYRLVGTHPGPRALIPVKCVFIWTRSRPKKSSGPTACA